MKDSLALGIDLGGSKIYAVVTGEGNRVLSSAKITTPSSESPQKIIKSMVETGEEALGKLGKKLGDVSDIDFAFAIGSSVYVAECKRNTHPTDIFEARATIDAIHKAERQLDRIVNEFTNSSSISLSDLFEHPYKENDRMASKTKII